MTPLQELMPEEIRSRLPIKMVVIFDNHQVCVFGNDGKQVVELAGREADVKDLIVALIDDDTPVRRCDDRGEKPTRVISRREWIDEPIGWGDGDLNHG